MSSPNKKSARSFQCRDTLWSTFEEMARELECSVDYLVNDAMKQYARQRGYKSDKTPDVAAPSGLSPVQGALPPPAAPPPPMALSPLAPPPLAPPPTSRLQAPPPLAPPTGASHAPPPLAPLSSLGAPRAPGPPPGRPPSVGGRATVPLSPDRIPPLRPITGGVAIHAPPPPPLPQSAAHRAPAPPAAASTTRSLVIHFEGRPHSVSKEHFIIGRGKTSSDLTIRDPNVSRQHALVEYSGGNFYMVDMGSTNGIEFSGQRVHRKAIAHGDVFRICEHELICSMS